MPGCPLHRCLHVAGTTRKDNTEWATWFDQPCLVSAVGLNRIAVGDELPRLEFCIQLREGVADGIHGVQASA